MATISECANPACDGSYERLSDGKLFESETLDGGQPAFVWLCETCMKRFTVEWRNGEPVLIRLYIYRRVRAA
jgi:hypothetical protein